MFISASPCLFVDAWITAGWALCLHRPASFFLYYYYFFSSSGKSALSAAATCEVPENDAVRTEQRSACRNYLKTAERGGNLKHGQPLCCSPRRSERTLTRFCGTEAELRTNPGRRPSAPPPFAARSAVPVSAWRHRAAAMFGVASEGPGQVAGRSGAAARSPVVRRLWLPYGPAAASCAFGFWLRRGKVESENAVTIMACLVGDLLWVGGTAGCLGKSRARICVVRAGSAFVMRA